MSQPRRYYPAQPRRIPSPEAGTRVLIFYKPYQVLSDFSDSEGSHTTLNSYIDVPGIYVAGRLDYDSEGLLLLTSNGQLAHLITHPKYKLEKVYLVQVENIPPETALKQLRQGIIIKGERTRPAKVELLQIEPEIYPRPEPIRYQTNIPIVWLKISLREGKKRQIRHMTAAVGHPTLRLIRVAIGPITLGQLRPGQWRDLSQAELLLMWRSLNQAASKR